MYDLIPDAPASSSMPEPDPAQALLGRLLDSPGEWFRLDPQPDDQPAFLSGINGALDARPGMRDGGRIESATNGAGQLIVRFANADTDIADSAKAAGMVLR